MVSAEKATSYGRKQREIKNAMKNLERYNDMKELLEKHAQEHLLRFYDELSGDEKAILIAQIEKLDFSDIPAWIEKYVKGDAQVSIPSEFEPAPSYSASAPAGQETEYAEAKEFGEKLISEGKVAAFVVAGGQGTRLGFDGPKGNFPISPVQNKTLFEIFGETILAASKKYGAVIPWYVMTSPLNYDATVEIFEKSDYFGIEKSDVMIFQQGTLPNFGFDGKILLSGKGCIASSPDGHGGSLKALFDSGAVADMKRRGVEQISYFQVDNPLVKLIEPLFIGLHAKNGAQMSSRGLVKSHPKEKVGNFCIVDGRMTVIEYSDLPDEYAEMVNDDGSLFFELGSIAIHVISREFVEDLNAGGFSLPIHRAVKKIPYIDAQGGFIEPLEPNGVKLETFVFDALPLGGKSIILQTVRSEEFAPVKNASGEDSPEVTRRMMTERAADWLERAFIKVPRKADGSVDCVIEIAPSFAFCAEDVVKRAGEIGEIKAGDRVYLEG